MLRRSVFLAALLFLVACSDCDNATCKEGITFYVSDVTGALPSGTNVEMKICFDGDCKDATVSRANSGPTLFLEFSGVGKDVDHTITVTGPGSLKGEYTGKVTSFTQKPNGNSCAGCALGAVKISADGTITPGSVATPATTAPEASATTGS